jgi:hypothetical protein
MFGSLGGAGRPDPAGARITPSTGGPAGCVITSSLPSVFVVVGCLRLGTVASDVMGADGLTAGLVVTVAAGVLAAVDEAELLLTVAST